MAETTHLVCVSCNAVNRVPGSRLAEGPRCGSCRKPLFRGAPAELTGAQFQAQIARNDIPLVVDFWASWCGPCKTMAPEFAAAAPDLEPEYRLAKVDTEAEPDLAARYAIRSIPTLVAFRQGREIGRQSGAMNRTGIVQWVRKLPS